MRRLPSLLVLILMLTFLASCGGAGTTTPVGVAIGPLCSGISFSTPVSAEAEYGVAVPPGAVELTVQNTAAVDRTVVVVAVDAENLPVVTSYNSLRQQPEVDVEALGLPVDLQYVNDRDGLQPVVDVDSLDSAALLGTLEAPESSEMTATIDVDPGTYLIMDPGFVFCEPPLLLSVAKEVVAAPTTTEPSTANEGGFTAEIAAPTTTEPSTASEGGFTAEIPEAFTSYTDEDAGFFIAYPDSWTAFPLTEQGLYQGEEALGDYGQMVTYNLRGYAVPFGGYLAMVDHQPGDPVQGEWITYGAVIRYDWLAADPGSAAADARGIHDEQQDLQIDIEPFEMAAGDGIKMTFTLVWGTVSEHIIDYRIAGENSDTWSIRFRTDRPDYYEEITDSMVRTFDLVDPQPEVTLADPTTTSAPATTTSPPATTTTQATIPASDPSIVAGVYEFAVVGAGFDTTMLGLEPAGLGAGDRILFVEFELLAGDRPSFEELEILITDGEGLESDAIALVSGGSILMLADLTMTGDEAAYRPDASSIAWAYVVPGAASTLALVFPSGEVVDLSPVLP